MGLKKTKLDDRNRNGKKNNNNHACMSASSDQGLVQFRTNMGLLVAACADCTNINIVMSKISADAAGLILFKFNNENISEEAHEITFFCTVYKELELNLRYKTTENM